MEKIDHVFVVVTSHDLRKKSRKIRKTREKLMRTPRKQFENIRSLKKYENPENPCKIKENTTKILFLGRKNFFLVISRFSRFLL